MALTVIGHRGARVEAPENTLLAFRKAIDAGADMIECDVQRTADNRLVIMHDPYIDRMTNMTGTVTELTWNQLAQAIVGGEKWPESAEKIPELADVLAVCAQGGIAINIEIKASEEEARALVDMVIDVVRQQRFPQNDVLLSCFDKRATEYMADQYSEFTVASLFKFDPGDLDQLPGTVIHPPMKIVDEQFMQRAKDAHKKVNVWTVNDPAQWQRAIELGVDGITTDDPRGLRTLLDG